VAQACQLCKLPFMLAQPQTGGGSLSQQLMARTNYASTNNLRKHHCRHCGRVICASCSPRRCVIAKFGSSAEAALAGPRRAPRPRPPHRRLCVTL